MNPVVIGVGDCRVSRDPQSVLITYALGSCIALMVYDRQASVGGLLHFLLPESSLDQTKAQRNPYMFADTGIPLLFRAAYEMGAAKRNMVVTAVGGAQMMDPNGTFNIGKRNHLAMRKILWKAGVLTQAEEVGGLISRTVRLEVATGRVLLREPGGGERDLRTPLSSEKGASNGLQRLDRG